MTAGGSHDDRGRPWRRWLGQPVGRLRHRFMVWSALAIATAAIAICCTPIGSLLDRDTLQTWLRSLGSGSAAAFAIVQIAATAVGVPGTALVVAGGAVFGLWWGSVLSVLGAGLGAVAAFALARTILHDRVRHHWRRSQTIARLNRALLRDPLAVVLTMRLAPISPFNVLNFLFGLTPVPWSAYCVGTIVGIIPGTVAYTWLGLAGRELVSGGGRWPLVGALSALALLSALPLLLKYLRPQDRSA